MSRDLHRDTTVQAVQALYVLAVHHHLLYVVARAVQAIHVVAQTVHVAVQATAVARIVHVAAQAMVVVLQAVHVVVQAMVAVPVARVVDLRAVRVPAEGADENCTGEIKEYNNSK